MGSLRARSRRISAMTRCCARVNVKDKRLRRALVSVALPGIRGALRLERARRCTLSDSCWARSSSNLSRVHAGCMRSSSACCDASVGGSCKYAMACANPHSRRGSRVHGGSVSPRYAGLRPSAWRTSLRNASWARPAVVGYTGVRRSGSGVPTSMIWNPG